MRKSILVTGIFDRKSPNFAKLESYGFCVDADKYVYTTRIYNGQFEMRVCVYTESSEVKTEIIDLNTGDPYTLHMIEGASGAFVGAIRAENERVLTDIVENCFEKNVFKSDYARRIIEYVRKKYGDELQYLWQKFPDNAVWRRPDNNKWYGAMMVLSKRKLGLDTDDIVDIIDLRVDPNELIAIADGKRYFHGYHMNKKNWLTVCLDGSVPIEEIFSFIDKSHDLAAKC